MSLHIVKLDSALLNKRKEWIFLCVLKLKNKKKILNNVTKANEIYLKFKF